MKSIKREIDDAVRQATEEVTVQVLRDHLGAPALKQLAAIIQERPDVGGVTINRLVTNGKVRARNGAVPNGKPRKFSEAVDLRDDAVRKRFDAKVLLVLTKLAKEAEDGVRMRDIHEQVGGSVFQLRGAVSRLRKQRRVKYQGTGRGRRYFMP